MYTLKLKHHFDASHHLNLSYDSPCQNQHGHRWQIEVQIRHYELNKNQMLVDFKEIKKIINKLDHCDLNSTLNFNPTAEMIAKYLYDEISKLIIGALVEITIWESPEASITYSL